VAAVFLGLISPQPRSQRSSLRCFSSPKVGTDPSDAVAASTAGHPVRRAHRVVSYASSSQDVLGVEPLASRASRPGQFGALTRPRKTMETIPARAARASSTRRRGPTPLPPRPSPPAPPAPRTLHRLVDFDEAAGNVQEPYRGSMARRMSRMRPRYSGHADHHLRVHVQDMSAVAHEAGRSSVGMRRAISGAAGRAVAQVAPGAKTVAMGQSSHRTRPRRQALQSGIS
jgi:hypothetical protein